MKPQHPKQSVCVFCGSRDGNAPEYAQAAADLGKSIAENNYQLVYGAGDVGLMGRVACAAQDAGGDIFGVIPVHLMRLEVGKRDLTSFVVTETMHERKKVMFMNADVIVTLPGGPGSLDEMFEVLTWRQLGIHDKPTFLLNINGYWDPLITLIDHMIAQGFASDTFLDYFEVVSSVEDLMPRIRACLS